MRTLNALTIRRKLTGRYDYAQTAADVGPAFAALQNQFLRLTD